MVPGEGNRGQSNPSPGIGGGGGRTVYLPVSRCWWGNSSTVSVSLGGTPENIWCFTTLLFLSYV